jgi:hypothetical protein
MKGYKRKRLQLTNCCRRKLPSHQYYLLVVLHSLPHIPSHANCKRLKVEQNVFGSCLYGNQNWQIMIKPLRVLSWGWKGCCDPAWICWSLVLPKKKVTCKWSATGLFVWLEILWNYSSSTRTLWSLPILCWGSGVCSYTACCFGLITAKNSPMYSCCTQESWETLYRQESTVSLILVWKYAAQISVLVIHVNPRRGLNFFTCIPIKDQTSWLKLSPADLIAGTTLKPLRKTNWTRHQLFL